MDRIKRRTLGYWAAIGLLAVLCCVLAVLQYRWIGEISRAEQDRLKSGLQSSLNRLSRDFNSQLAAASTALLPANSQIEEAGREEAYAARYSQWRNNTNRDRLFLRVALAIPHDGRIVLRILDQRERKFFMAEWPESWVGMKKRLEARLSQGAPGPFAPPDSAIVELPRFGRAPRTGALAGVAEQEWLLLELNMDYIRSELIPRLIQRHLAPGGTPEYETEIFVRSNPSSVVYQSEIVTSLEIRSHPDASVTLFEVQPFVFARRLLEGGASPGTPQIAAGDSGRGRWQMVVRHRSGSLDTIIAGARTRNLWISAAILALIVATITALVRFSRQAHALAELQMSFVAGVSHELRTPLTVIRTAGFNLQGRVAANRGQVERYGKLIQEESEKLTSLVEQVLQFASAEAGRVLRSREPVSVENLIEQGLRSSGNALQARGCVVEKHVEAGLPPVLADETALKHAIQNLVENAVKYGIDGSNWIGVSASKVNGDSGAAVEIRVADRGPGIPVDEQKHIFDPFFRGRRSVEDQIHGTGLGLNLVKRIIEAHGGTVRVKSQPSKGAEFIVRIPAAPPELAAGVEG